MDDLFTLNGAVPHDDAIDEWLAGEPQELFAIARHWFERCRACGSDVTELIHDGCPVACVQGAAFAYVKVFRAHVNVGFFNGAFLVDPHQLLEGSGKRMRHVKLRPGAATNARALSTLIESAYRDVKGRLRQ